MTIIRKIRYTDYYKFYMELINTFTRIPVSISYDEFCNGIDDIDKQNSHIYVIEEEGIIIGTMKVFIEHKLHNNLRPVAHIEDVVIHQKYRKQGLGTLLIEYAKDVAKSHNCYKTVLSCNKENVEFYKSRGFIEKGTEMTIYIS